MSLCFNSDADCSTQCWRWLTEINGTVRSLRGAVRNNAQFTAPDRRRCDKTVEFRRIGQCEWSLRQSARIYTVPPPQKKRPPFILLISVKNHSILMIFGKLKPEKIWHKSHKDLSMSPVGCSHFTLEMQKNHFQQYYLYMLLRGEVNKSVRFSCQIFSVFNVPKIIKNRLIFDRVIQKNRKVDFLWNTGKRSLTNNLTLSIFKHHLKIFFYSSY